MTRRITALCAAALLAAPIAARAQYSWQNPSFVPNQATPIVCQNPVTGVIGSCAGGGQSFSASTGFQAESVSGTAVGISPPAGSRGCYIQAESQAVRYRTDTTAPTASVGMPLAIGPTLLLTVNLSGVKFIAQTGTATLDVDCYK